MHRQGGNGGKTSLVCRAEELDWTLLLHFFLQFKETNVPTHKGHPKKSAGCVPPAGMCWLN